MSGCEALYCSLIWWKFPQTQPTGTDTLVYVEAFGLVVYPHVSHNCGQNISDSRSDESKQLFFYTIRLPVLTCLFQDLSVVKEVF